MRSYNPLVRYSQATYVRAVLGAALLALPVSASGQLRVDTRIYASSSSCAQCDLSGKRMNGMTLKNANFAGSLFNNSNLSGGKLHGTDLTGAHFRKAMLYGVTGEQVIMRGAMMEDATLTEAHLSNSTLRQANLHRAELSRGIFTDSDFQSANLIGANAPSVDFTRSNFDRARMDNADLTDATLDGGQFTGVRFGFANMEGASLNGTNLSDADMTHVVGLQQAQLDQACGNMNTRLPIGFSLGYCDGAQSPVAQAASLSLPSNLDAASQHLNRAILDVETLLAVETESSIRTRLQRIHRDLVESHEAMSR